MEIQEKQKITIEAIYKAVRHIQQQLDQINEKLEGEAEFTEEENNEFIDGTREAWKEIDEGKYTKYNSPEEFLATFRSSHI